MSTRVELLLAAGNEDGASFSRYEHRQAPRRAGNQILQDEGARVQMMVGGVDLREHRPELDGQDFLDSRPVGFGSDKKNALSRESLRELEDEREAIGIDGLGHAGDFET